LFFDLVFVFAITQLTTLLAQDPTIIDLVRIVLIFGNIWWMYGGYAWLTNAVPPREPALRLLILVGMAGFLIVALAIPHAFGDSGVVFGLGYLVVTVVHTGMFLRTSEESALRALGRLGPFNAISALLLLLAGFTDGAVRWTLWSASFVLHWITPYFIPVSGFSIRSAHFVERHGLIILIALGESVVALGMGLAGRDLRPGFILTSVLGLSVAAALWWLYFDGEDERAERALRGADRARSPWLALYAFGYAFFVILGGIIVLAAGVKLAIVRSAQPVPAPAAWFLAGGGATYVVGLAWFRRLLGTGPLSVRLIVALLALSTGLVGLAVSAEAQLGVLLAILGGGSSPNHRWHALKRKRGGCEGRPVVTTRQGVRAESLTHPWQCLDKV
jgi:low temperature requirement protein LtrA